MRTFTQIPNEVITCCTGNEIAIFVVLASFTHGYTRPCHQSLDAIRKATGFGRILISKTIKSLIAKGLLTYTRGNSKGNSNSYSLHVADRNLKGLQKSTLSQEPGAILIKKKPTSTKTTPRPVPKRPPNNINTNINTKNNYSGNSNLLNFSLNDLFGPLLQGNPKKLIVPPEKIPNDNIVPVDDPDEIGESVETDCVPEAVTYSPGPSGELYPFYQSLMKNKRKTS